VELRIRRFEELSNRELFELYRARMAVFVVEEGFPYQDVEDRDREARHVFLWEDGQVVACLRAFERDARTGQLGRVLTRRRRQGLGTAILRAGLRVVLEDMGKERVYLEARTNAARLYEKEGFRRVSGEFLEAGVPHVAMVLEKRDWRRDS